MASFFIDTFVTVPQTLNGGEAGVVGSTGSLASNSLATVAGSGNFGLAVYGSVTAFNAAGVFASGVGSADIFVGTTGSISSANYEALFIFASTVFSLANNGAIHGYQNGIEFQDNGAAAFAINNTGSITSTTSNTIEGVLATGSAIINNSGTLASAGSGAAISVNGGIASGVEIANSGTISVAGTVDNAIFLFVGTAQLSNQGIILGNVTIDTDGNAEVTNTGLIQGNLSTTFGADRIDLRGGQVTGEVSGGQGGDIYLIDQSGVVLVEFGVGHDRVQSEASYRLADNIEELTLLGSGNINGAGNSLGNVVGGNAGDNRLSGLAGNDTMTGDLGDDRMLGGVGHDTMLGGDGDDLLQGNVGNDTARGEDGDDVVNGGAGSDLIAGGAGMDTFVFSALAHTTNVLGTADIVSDFVKGEDKVDLSAIDAITTNATPDNAFTFIGTGAFTNVAGQLRYSQAAGYTNVEMDVDGNGTIDGIVRLFGTITLNASDFTL